MHVFMFYSLQVLNACRTVALHPLCEISKENLDVFFEMWTSLCQDVISIYKEISELCRRDIQYKTVYMSLPRPGVSIFVNNISNLKISIHSFVCLLFITSN